MEASRGGASDVEASRGGASDEEDAAREGRRLRRRIQREGIDLTPYPIEQGHLPIPGSSSSVVE